VLLQDRLYVEILDPDGRPVAPGERGEITVTGGFNFCLPLLRYRTGDHAALIHTAAEPVLRGLAGRASVRFRHADGHWLNNIDVSHALGHLPLAHYGLHQQADGALVLRLPARSDCTDDARLALRALLGALPLTIAPIGGDDKIMQYSSDLEGATA
jgi:phenylacetate-CoA ligase